MSRHLPERPNLEHLRKQAKALLPLLQQRTPSSRLADAQRAIAVQHGFSDWSSLKAHIEAHGRQSRLVGLWSIDLSRPPQPDRSLEPVALFCTMRDDVLTITELALHASGREERSVNSMVADGQERPSEHGYALTARWLSARLLAAVVTKAGHRVSDVTYEVSGDGDTLTVSAAAAAHDGYPAVSQVTVFNREPIDWDSQESSRRS